MAVPAELPADLRIAALGPLQVLGRSGPLLVRAPKQRRLLGLLAVRPNQPIAHRELAEALWGAEPPAAWQDLLYTYMHRLRKVVAEDLIDATSSGYLLRTAARQLDVLRFTELAEQAAGSSDPAVAADLYDQALSCWRAPTLSDFPQFLRNHPSVVALDRHRVRAALARADLAELLGDYERVVPMLRELAAVEPLNESLAARLMICLAGAGEPTVALALYAEIRSRLRDELGLEPDRELRDAQLRVLRQRVVPGRLRPPPRLTSFTLPRTVDDFTGRTDEMSLLTSPTATVRCIDGMPGVGKTTLAVELAHHLAPHYPDAQLLVDLQAHSGPPLAPRDALLRLLGGLGIELPRTPDLPSCVDLWRRWTAGHRALLVLDDAASAEQVRPLLPTGSGCLVVVTSRTRLPGLESSHRLSLDVLQLDQAFTLVSRIVGDSRATGQRDAVEEVARLCGYLPLAVRIAASRLRDRPAWSADHLARQLKNGLTELKTGDRSVEAAFSLSYAQLTTAQQRFFRCLGVFPGVEIDEYAAAALADLRPAAAADLLEQLVDVHLLEQPRQSRYRFHDLVRQHAQQTARSVDPAADRAEALRRVVDYYLQVADQAATLIEPHRQRFEPEQAKPAQLPDLLNAAGATSWLEAERPNLTATVTIAAERGWHQVTWQLAQCLWRYYLVRGHLLDWLETHEKALNSARLIGDPIAEAETLKNLGIAYLRLGRFDEAVAVHEQALSLDVSSQDQVGAAKTHNNLGFVLSTSGSLDQALSHHQEAAKLYRIVSDPSGEGRALVGLGNALHRLGEYETALGHYRRATALTRTADDAWGETLAAAGAGFSLLRKGRVAPAQDEFRAAYDLAKAHADRGGECLALVGLGLVHLREGRDDEARTHLQAGLWIADEAGEIWGGELAREAMLHLADGVTVNQLEPRNAG